MSEELPDPNRVLVPCRDCGKYTESLLEHYTYRCEAKKDRAA